VQSPYSHLRLVLISATFVFIAGTLHRCPRRNIICVIVSIVVYYAPSFSALVQIARISSSAELYSKMSLLRRAAVMRDLRDLRGNRCGVQSISGQNI